MLGDDLLQLLQSVLLELRRGVVGHIPEEGGAVQRQVDPDEQAEFVAAVVQIPGVGHDGRPQGVGPEVEQAGQVGVVVLPREQSARNGVVVVEVDAVHGRAHAVDREAPAGGDGDRAESRADGDAVGRLLLAERDRHGVERRRIGAPQRRVLDGKGDEEGLAVESHALPFREDGLPVGCRDAERQRAGVFAFRREVYFGLAVDALAAHRRGAYEHAFRSEIEGRDGRAVGDDELRRAEDAAVEVHVRRRGQHVVAVAVAHDHAQGVVGAEAHLVRDLEHEGRAGTAVRPGV